MSYLFRIGVVVIGRNEGERLRLCLKSTEPKNYSVVYVDSGSVDNSVVMAREMGVKVVNLDMAMPFSAARARNAGYEMIIQMVPDTEFVQFIDGDCELEQDWLSKAVNTLTQKRKLAIVAGCLNEKHPDHSIYNRLAELEWNFHGEGEVDAVGGIFMVKRSAFDEVGGFDPSVMAGEEPELCQRLRVNGWVIFRLGENMAKHDLAMMRFTPWWKRQIRAGYGGLDVATRFGLSDFRKNSMRARFWSLWLIVLLIAALSSSVFVMPKVFLLASGLMAFIWPLQLCRIGLRQRLAGNSSAVSMAYAWFTMLSFFPQMIGQIHYLIDMKLGKGVRLIEYKSGTNSSLSHDKKDAHE